MRAVEPVFGSRPGLYSLRSVRCLSFLTDVAKGGERVYPGDGSGIHPGMQSAAHVTGGRSLGCLGTTTGYRLASPSGMQPAFGPCQEDLGCKEQERGRLAPLLTRTPKSNCSAHSEPLRDRSFREQNPTSAERRFTSARHSYLGRTAVCLGATSEFGLKVGAMARKTGMNVPAPKRGGRW